MQENCFVREGKLVFKADDPIAVKSCVPQVIDMEYKGDKWQVVPHTLDAVKVLRNIGVNVPSPINFEYAYPGRHKPFIHQKLTTDFLTLNRRAFVLSGMGSGKTAAALWAADYLMTKGEVRRVLVVAPLSTLTTVWQNEAFAVLMKRVAVVVRGTRDKKRKLLASSAEILITNYDTLKGLQSDIFNDPTIDLIIVDEASHYRNSRTDRYEALKACLRPTTRLWLMTATPVSGCPADAWALARLVSPSRVPQYFSHFQRQVMRRVSQFKWVPTEEGVKIAYEALQPAVRFKTEECVDLPPVTYIDRECGLSDEQAAALADMKSQLVASTSTGGTISAANAAVKLSKLMQIATGAVYDDEGTPHVLDCAPRLSVLDEILEEADRKVIIWVPFKHCMALLAKHLEGRYSVATVSGDTPQSERTEIFASFQQENEGIQVLIAHPATAAHGLTLVSANVAVWFGPIFSNELYIQANARINRPGQRHHMTVVHLGAAPFEWGAYAVAKTKEAWQQRLLELYQSLIRRG